MDESAGGRGDYSFVLLLIGRMSCISIDGIAGGQSPTIRSETFVMFRVADAVSTVHQCQVAHFVEVTGAVFIFLVPPDQVRGKSIEPRKAVRLRCLIAEVQLDSFHFMRGDDGSVLRPAIVIDGCRYSVGRRGCGQGYT